MNTNDNLKCNDISNGHHRPYPSWTEVLAQARSLLSTQPEPDTQAEETAFAQAGEEWKAKTGRRYPTWSEVIKIAKDLGYTKSQA